MQRKAEDKKNEEYPWLPNEKERMFWDMVGWMFGEKDTNVNENKKHQKSAYLKAMTIHGVKDGRGLFEPTYIVGMMASCRQ